MIGNTWAKAFLAMKSVLPCLPVSFAVAAILLLLPTLIRDHIYGIGPLPALIVIGVFGVSNYTGAAPQMLFALGIRRGGTHLGYSCQWMMSNITIVSVNAIAA